MTSIVLTPDTVSAAPAPARAQTHPYDRGRGRLWLRRVCLLTPTTTKSPGNLSLGSLSHSYTQDGTPRHACTARHAHATVWSLECLYGFISPQTTHTHTHRTVA